MASFLRLSVALAGLAAVLGALVSLAMPLALHVVDRTGVPIACGTGWRTDDVDARHEDALNHQAHLLVGTQFVVSDYAGECASLVAERRGLAAGVAGTGAVLTAGLLLAPYAAGRLAIRRRAAAAPYPQPVTPYAAWR